MGALFLALFGCAAQSATAVTVAGTLVPRWWGDDTDPDTEGAKLIVRLDDPVPGVATVLYATPKTASPAAAACLNGKVVLKGVLERLSDVRYADAAMATAEVVGCSPSVGQAPVPLGPDAVLTGTLERRWRYGSPGYGANPAEDRVNIGAALLFDDGSVVSVEMPRTEQADLLAFWSLLRDCDGKVVTITGTHRATKRADARPPFVVDGARVTGGCGARP